MRIVLDTNVLVSALLKTHSQAARILRLILQGEMELVANNRILSEYEEVLARPKFNLPAREVKTVMEILRLRCLLAPEASINLDLPDKDDAPFVEAALSGRADCLVTGNKKHYPAKCCRGIKILSPREFLSLLN